VSLLKLYSNGFKQNTDMVVDHRLDRGTCRPHFLKWLCTMCNFVK